ncbi:hypothetical protein IKS86_09670 [bacterium]|nr:hypothetical protein [bacterium]
MKKSCFFVFLAFLFVVSCSNGDDPLIPCITVADCPDTSYSCFDGFCVHAGSLVDPTDSDNDNSSDNTVPDDDQNDDENSSDGNNSNNDGDSERPDSVNDNENSESSSDKDNDETSDSDGTEGDDSSETSDVDDIEENDGETTDGNNGESGDNESDPSSNDEENSGDEDADSDSNDSENSDEDVDIEENPVGQVTNCDTEADCASNINNKRCDTTLNKCVICVSDSDCDPALGQKCDLSTHECVSNATCAAAIERLPYAGVYDWEDGTTQGFSTNAYWNLVNDSILSNGAYSFGQYSGYTDNMDYTSVLQPVDLSKCSGCVVNVLYYAKGTIPKSENGYDFIHPTCNGEGKTTARNSTVSIQSLTPQSPWEMAEAYYQKVNSYSTVAWTTSEWQLPASCKTDKFVFGLRFSSNGSISYATNHSYLGLVVDDLTIASAATGYVPNGEFESAANGYIKGWVCDLDNIDKNILVKVEYYKNNESTASATRWVYANIDIPSSSDSPLATQCNGTYNHGFGVPFDSDLYELLGVGTHSAAVFAVDIPSAENNCAGTYKELGKKEFQITNSDPKQQ